MPFKVINEKERREFIEKGSRPQISYLQTSLPVFVPQDGENTIRILPAVEEDKHAYLFGVEIWTYFLQNRLYVSPRAFNGKATDPVADKFFEERQTDEALAEKFRGSRRFVMHILDLNDAKQPVLKIWPAPISLVEDIISVSQVTRSGKIIPVEDPKEGRKIFFKKQGQGMNTKYCQMIIDDEFYPISEEMADHIKPFEEIIRVDSEEVLASVVKAMS